MEGPGDGAPEGPPGDGAVVGDTEEGAGEGTAIGDGEGEGEGDGTGVGAGDGGVMTGAGVGAAVGETVGVAVGACAVHELMKTAMSIKDLNNVEEPMFMFSHLLLIREIERVDDLCMKDCREVVYIYIKRDRCNII